MIITASFGRGGGGAGNYKKGSHTHGTMDEGGDRGQGPMFETGSKNLPLYLRVKCARAV